MPRGLFRVPEVPRHWGGRRPAGPVGGRVPVPAPASELRADAAALSGAAGAHRRKPATLRRWSARRGRPDADEAAALF